MDGVGWPHPLYSLTKLEEMFFKFKEDKSFSMAMVVKYPEISGRSVVLAMDELH